MISQLKRDMVQRTATLDLNIRWIVWIYFYNMFLFTILCHISSGRPIDTTSSVLTSNSVENIRKKVKSRVARHASDTQLAWKEVYLHSMNGFNLAVNEAGEVYGARDYTPECKFYFDLYYFNFTFILVTDA